jgi:putative addiction module killer protein
MIEIVAYVDASGASPFARWFGGLDRPTATKVTTALSRIEQGNLSNLKGLGGGLSECRLNFGPGYRLYLGRRGDRVVLLLSGGTKRRQSDDIARARAYLADYEDRFGRRLH